MNTPYIINYSNSVSCFPAIQIIDGNVRIQTNSIRLAVTGHARDILTILPGDYLLADTGDETSQLRKITGINTINRKIVIEEPFTVVPTDTVIRVVKVQSADTICVYNSGVADLYIDGEILASGDKLLWTNMTGEPPIVLYGTGDYQVSNGDIVIPAVLQPEGHALTRANDTNITLTLTGTPTTALLQDVTITAGWQGTLADARIASAAYWNSKEDALGFTPENVANKATDFSTVNDTLYPTVEAVQEQLDLKTGYVGTPVNLTAQNAAIAATTAYTLPASDGVYRVSMVLTITTAAGTSSTIGFQCRFTNASDNVVKTSPNINDATRSASNTTGTVVTYTYLVHAKASTDIQYIVNYASNAANAAVYDFYLVVEKLS